MFMENEKKNMYSSLKHISTSSKEDEENGTFKLIKTKFSEVVLNQALYELPPKKQVTTPN